jgi:hypothetical protein
MQYYPLLIPPKKVVGYQDRLSRLEADDLSTYIMRLPYKSMQKILNSFWSNFYRFTDLIYTHVPVINSYTMKQKQKIIH